MAGASATRASATTPSSDPTSSAGEPTVSSFAQDLGSSIDEATREFSFADCDWLGFDLDHTLARYRLQPTNELIFRSMTRYAVNKMGYGSDLLQLDPDDHFGLKGVIFHKTKGNFLEICDRKQIRRMYHGTVLDATLEQTYPGGHLDLLSDFEGDHQEELLPFTTYFELPVAYLLAVLVDKFDAGENPAGCKSYSELTHRLFRGFHDLYADMDEGAYFPAVFKEPERYLYKRDNVRAWLERLRAAGKRLFIVTNSQHAYFELLMKFAYGDDWQELFDFVIVFGRKPGFFSDSNQAFLRVDDRTGSILHDDPVPWEKINPKQIYAHGNAADLTKCFMAFDEAKTGVAPAQPPRVVYFGDHLSGDVRATQDHSAWLAVAILEELDEGEVVPAVDAVTDAEFEEYERLSVSKHWGSFFASFQNRSFWNHYVTTHANLAIPCLSVLIDLPFDKKFQFRKGHDHCYFPPKRDHQQPARSEERPGL